MKRFFTFALACLLSVAASTAQATVLSSYLTFDGPAHHTVPVFQGGGEDFLQDDSVSAFANRAGGASYDVGDVVWGVLTLSDIQASGLASVPVPSPQQIAIVFSAEITGLAGPGGAIELGPIGDALDPLDLRNLLAGSAGAAHVNDNTMAVILSTDDADLPSEDPLNFSTANFTANFASGIWDWELTADLLDADDFFHFRDLSAVLGPNEGNDRAALTITSNAFGGDWLPVDVPDYAGTIHFGDLTLFSGAVHSASASQQSRGWTFSDDSSLYVNPVPEPGSMAVFGLLGAAAFARARRRNKK